MKRSTINKSIEVAKKVFAAAGLHLPPFAYWTVKDWQTKGPEADEIRLAQLGWDVTDFGSGKFEEYGRTLFTLRNGYRTNGSYNKTYGEKFILNPPGQRAPLHFHRNKMEDIINRGGGSIMIRLYASTPDGKCSDEPFIVHIDGVKHELEPGSIVRLQPGESIYIYPGLIHQFWGEGGFEIDGVCYTVSGEVSSICDDWHDNCFLEPMQRFPEIEEDEPRLHYLCHEYPPARCRE
jgi:D-lyxose ketol-isomerase